MKPDVTPLHTKRRFPLVSFDQIKLTPGSPFLVKGLVPREGLVVIWGPPKCGKSFFVYDIAMHVALGWQYRERRVAQGTVVYIACEGERGLGARTEAFRLAKLTEEPAAVPFYLLSTRIDLADDCNLLIADIRAQLGEQGCSAIVIDTLNRSIGGSESDDADMGAYIKGADALREAFRCAVIIIHHCGVDDRRPRGHTSLLGAADAQIAVKRNAADGILATVEFMKDGAIGEPIHSTLKVIELGEDDDGEPLTSCVIEPAESGEQTPTQSRRRLAGTAQVLLDLLKKAVNEAGQDAPVNDHIPRGRRVVSKETARNYAYAGSISEADTTDAKRKAFGRALTQLQANGMVGMWNDWIWLI